MKIVKLVTFNTWDLKPESANKRHEDVRLTDLNNDAFERLQRADVAIFRGRIRPTFLYYSVPDGEDLDKFHVVGLDEFESSIVKRSS